MRAYLREGMRLVADRAVKKITQHRVDTSWSDAKRWLIAKRVCEK